MKKQLSLKESFNNAWNRFDLKEKIFVVFAFLVSLGFTLYGMIPTLFSGNLNILHVLSIIMSIFGFVGTWTLAIQWQHTFKANGIQNVAGILVAGIQGVYGEMFKSCYYLATEFIGHYNWKKRRNDNGELVVDKKFSLKDVLIAVFFWTFGLGFISYWMGGQKIVLDAITNGLSFTAQQRQVKGRIDGYYIWLVVDLLSFILYLSIGNPIVAFSYLGMVAQGFVGIIIWKKSQGQESLAQETVA